MTKIKFLAQTSDTVTLRRKDFRALMESADDRAALAAIDAHRAYEERVGWDVARRNYFTVGEAERLIDGESPVRVWREKREMTQRALAEAAKVSVSYLAEIEGGKKPGSAAALQRLGKALDVPMEQLVAGFYRKSRRAR
jgi:ribosome-binding protein aMBF1 (putative translation factor)